MPLKKYSKKRTFAKKRSSFRKKTYSRNKSLVALIKKVSLSKCETKHTHHIEENIQLNHNAPYVSYEHLNTTTSVSDDSGGTSTFACRLGDEIVARGLSYKFWFANKLDRPNVMYKLVFFKYKSGGALAAPTPYYTQGSANYMIRDLDTEKFKIIKVVNFNLQTNAQRVQTQLGSPVITGAEGHKAVSVWLPMKNQKIKYENGTSTPKFQDIAYTIVAYDSFGTSTGDNIASFAVNRKLYFKDP